jgi:Na+/melibiose symporter-like transporter
VFLVENERTKLTASWFNALAAALVAAGVFAPVAAIMYGLSHPSFGSVTLLLSMIGCFAGGVFLHWLGRAVLGRLRE